MSSTRMGRAFALALFCFAISGVPAPPAFAASIVTSGHVTKLPNGFSTFDLAGEGFNRSRCILRG